MNFKKSLILILSLVLVFSLAACGKNDKNNAANNNTPNQNAGNNGGNDGQAADEQLTPEPGAKLLVWSSAGNEKAFMDEAIKAYKDKYGIEVEFQDVGPDKSFERMITDGPAGVGADVFMGVHDRLGSAVQAGVIMPVDVHEDELKANDSEKSIDAFTMDGILYGYPMSVETIAVFYNKDIIADTPKTWDDVIKFAEGYNDVKAKKYAYMWEAGNGYWNWGFWGGYGAYVFGNNGSDANDIGLNTPEAVEAAKFFQSLKKILPMATGDLTADIKTSLFEEGKLAMNVSGPWQTQQFKGSIKNLGLMEFPTLPNGNPMKPFSGVKGFCINANTKYPNAAKLFAQLITSQELQLKNFELNGNLPANKAAAADSKVTSDPFASVFLKQFDNSTPMPKIAEMGAYWGTHEAVFGSLWNDQKDAQATMDAWVKNMKDNIAASK